MSSFAELPLDLHEVIINKLLQNDRVSLSSTNKYFNTEINRSLYKEITIDDKIGTGTHLDISNLNKFTNSLRAANFKNIKLITIQAQSNLILHDYTALYEKVYKLWDQCPGHQIKFINYDTKNLRQFQSMTHFVYEKSCYFLQEENCSLVNMKINNLQNWLVSEFHELIDLPYNENLRSLKLLVEKDDSLIRNGSFNNLGLLNRSLTKFRDLEELYLSTPISTRKFFQYFSNEVQLNLKSLALTWSHSYKDNSKLSFEMLSNLIKMDSIEKLEIKVNCVHSGCQCINEFFNDMGEIPNLEEFVLVNYNSNNSPSNLSQFNKLLTNQSFYQSIKEVKSVCINISDCFNNNRYFDLNLLMKNLNQLSNLQEVTIPDYFKTWQVNFVENLNTCKCHECNETRISFKQMALFDASNNYKHEFKKFKHEVESSNVIESTKVNLNFFNYLVSNLKKQFLINIYSTNSIINFDGPFVSNPKLVEFNQLFAHSKRLKGKTSVTYNFGGVVM